MTEKKGKLDAWLSGEGLIGKKILKTKRLPEKETSKVSTTAEASKPKVSRIIKKDGKIILAGSEDKPRRTNSTSSGSRGGGRFVRPDLRAKGGTNDPFFNRPTVAKRDEFHPTNTLQSSSKPVIRVVPMGGMEQVGMNVMFLEWDDDIIIIDLGLVFPDASHLGVDALIPDISYLVERKNKIKGVIFTHGHLDHVGGAPYMLKDLGYPPCYATPLTKEILLAQCEEHLDVKRMKVQEINPKSRLKLGNFDCEFFHVNHSVPDGVGIVVNTPYGAITNSSDFKFDYNPSDDQPSDLGRIAEIGKNGVVLALNDSTCVMKPGHTVSERVIEEELCDIIRREKGRIVMATFASNVGRVGKIIEAAEKAGRVVFLSGRSMERNIAIARKLNYLKCKDRTLNRMGPAAQKMDPQKVLVLSTGSQGEELAALTRMAAGVHKDVKLSAEDTIVFSSSPIPGNEMQLVAVQNNLALIGCKVLDNKEYNTHVSGHGHAEELKLMYALLNPKNFAPIHGEIYMRYAHKKLIVDNFDQDPDKCFVMLNGRGIILDGKGVRLMTEKEAIKTGDVFVQMGEKAPETLLEDRRKIAEYGLIFAHINHDKGKIKNITFRAKGFLYMNLEHEAFGLIEREIKNLWSKNYDAARPGKALENMISKACQKILWQKFRKETIVEIMI